MRRLFRDYRKGDCLSTVLFSSCFQLGNMKGDYLVIDIGSKTTDVVYVQKGLPVESKSITIKKAVVKWVKEIQHDMKVQTGKEIPEYKVVKVILKEENHLPAICAELVCRLLRVCGIVCILAICV